MRKVHTALDKLRMSKQVNRELIEKFLRGKCSFEEQELVQLFLKKPESEELLNEILTANAPKDWLIFENDQSVHPKQEEWRNSIQERIGYKRIKTRKNPGYILTARNAAIWIVTVLTALGIYAINSFNPKNDQLVFAETINPNGQRSKIILSDSSIVYLGADSRLKYPEKFSSHTREIYLEGEAFFEVTKNPGKPFIIHTGTVQTQVLGTSFKIEAFKEHPLVVMVEVATGKVKVDQVTEALTKSLAILIPGQKVVFDHGKVRLGEVDPEEVRDLKKARLTFNDVSLYDISTVLQRWYNVKIIFKRAAKSKERMTLTLDASVSLNKILNVLATAGHFNYKIENREIIIR